MYVSDLVTMLVGQNKKCVKLYLNYKKSHPMSLDFVGQEQILTGANFGQPLSDDWLLKNFALQSACLQKLKFKFHEKFIKSHNSCLIRTKLISLLTQIINVCFVGLPHQMHVHCQIYHPGYLQDLGSQFLKWNLK